MKKQSIIISLIIVVLILLGGFGYWQYSPNTELNVNENTNIDNEQNTDEIDTSDWTIFKNEFANYIFHYPSDKYDAKSTIDPQEKSSGSGLYLKEGGVNNAAVVFYSKVKNYIANRGATSADVMGYKQDDGKFYFTGGYKTDKAIIPSTFIETSLGVALVINGADKKNIEFEVPEKQYIAVLNLEGNDFTGIAIYGFGNLISYEEFLKIVRSLRAIK